MYIVGELQGLLASGNIAKDNKLKHYVHPCLPTNFQIVTTISEHASFLQFTCNGIRGKVYEILNFAIQVTLIFKSILTKSTFPHVWKLLQSPSKYT